MEQVGERGLFIEDDLVWRSHASAFASNYVKYFHRERNHQGNGNMFLFPANAGRIGESSGEIRSRQRPGGLLKFYFREAS
jgi:hypothetical protein